MMWIFGYGSLIWRPDIPFCERRVAYVVGYRRRFWQGSTDHRGVPGAPGRVVTMVPKAAAQCWGMAYRIDEQDQEAVLSRLDYREKGGYERLSLQLHERDGRRFGQGLAYIATADNANYLGCAPLPAIAEQVRQAVGPSGPNIDYVLNLADALAELRADDRHVSRLAALLRASPSPQSLRMNG